MSATAADELAAESKELGHSILTYALLAGVNAADKGPLAKQPIQPGKAGQGIDVLEWFRYAKRHVPELNKTYIKRAQEIELSGDCIVPPSGEPAADTQMAPASEIIHVSPVTVGGSLLG